MVLSVLFFTLVSLFGASSATSCGTKVSEASILRDFVLSASSESTKNKASDAFTVGWCASGSDTGSPRLNVDFKLPYSIRSIVVASPTNRDSNPYPTSVLVKYVPNVGDANNFVDFPLQEGKLEIKMSQPGQVETNFGTGIAARELQFTIQSFHGESCLKIDLIGCIINELCSGGCQQNGGLCVAQDLCQCPQGTLGDNCELKACVPADLGLADGRIGADHVTVSSQDPEYTKAEIGNENNKKGWCPSLTDKSPWVQLKLDQPKAVSLFKFMWSQKGGQTIMTEFELQYIAAVDSARQLRTFAKNIPSMNNTHIFHVTIDPVVVTDTIRIIPSNWDTSPCFKLEIEGCDPKALCSADFCLNGGTCMGENDCLCPSGFVGRRCELAANQIRETNITFVNKEHNTIVLVSGNGTSVEERNITVETVNDSCIILRETSLTPSCLIDINYCNNGFTLAVNINFGNLLENTYIVSSDGDLPDHSGIALYYSNNQLHYIVSTTTQTWKVVVNYPPVLHTWQHFELTWNKHLGIEILVNGHSLGSNAHPSPKQASSNINNLSIGCTYTSNNSLVNMQVSEINFWSLDRTSLVNAGIKKPAVLQTTPMSSVNMFSSTTVTGRPLTTETVLLETTTNAETTTSTEGQHWRFEDAIKADCSSTGWNISMDINILRLLYPGITDTDIYLGPEKCHGSRYDNVLLFQQTFDTCMTAEKDVDGTTLFQNTLFYAIFDPVDPYMVRRHVWTYSVACYLTKEETVTAHLHHSVESHSTNITGHRDITLAFYRDQNFLHQITGNLLKVHVGDKIYVKVMTAIPDWNTKMRLHTCYTRPSYKTTQHFLITDGCEVDSSTHIISQSTHETKFVFQDFEYLTFDEGLDIFCSATFCDANDYSPECTQACRQGPSIIG